MVQALARNDAAASKQKEIELFVYQLSNNLIEDEDDTYVDEEGKYTKIMTHPTGRAFVQNLLSAAVNTLSLDLCEALLDAGADPDAIVDSWMTGYRERPIQISMDSRIANTEMLELFIHHGAVVDLTTRWEERTALHKAAQYSTVEDVKILVDAGADVMLGTEFRFGMGSVLTCAAQGGRWRDHELDEDDDGGEPNDRPTIKKTCVKQCRTVPIVKYLLPFFSQEVDYDLIHGGLVAAASSKRTDLIPLFIDAGADRVQRRVQGQGPPSPLHVAASHGEERMVQLLIEGGSRIDARVALRTEHHAEMLGSIFTSPYSAMPTLLKEMAHCTSPLQLALYRNTGAEWSGNQKGTGAALALIRAGATLYGGELAQAAAFPDLDLIRELLARGADVNETDFRNRTALRNCINFRNFKLVQPLLDAGARLSGAEMASASEQRILEAAATSKNWDMLCWLVQSKQGMGSSYSSSVVCAAVCSGLGSAETWEATIDTLLLHRPPSIPVDLMEATAMGCAAVCGHTALTTALRAIALGHRRQLSNLYTKAFWNNPRNLTTSTLTPAIVAGRWKIIDALLDSGCRPDKLSLLAALEFAFIRRWDREEWSPEKLQDHTDKTLRLVTRLTDVMELSDVDHAADPTLGTPLQLAAKFKRPDIVRHLVSLGVDVNKPAPTGKGGIIGSLLPRTALQAAVEVGDSDMIDLLLLAGADIGTARRLISLGADVNAPGAAFYGRTALAAAAERGRLDTVKFLLEIVANASGDDEDGYYRAVWLAKKNGYTSVVNVLREWRTVQCGEDHDSDVSFYESSGYGSD
ncbi:unnamed protein product [Parascedosporium putredinis]|uniref:Ankyrin n=1 Tax=Parascedosporium putredinis TaxID=1442378 RepID=A0A9P1H1R0_9PEZI|nr:unnamed protein product [Parascedosporium putredinis]CAI7993996.1 unnamed protein product [Parascedosporium putredinis]